MISIIPKNKQNGRCPVYIISVVPRYIKQDFLKEQSQKEGSLGFFVVNKSIESIIYNINFHSKRFEAWVPTKSCTPHIHERPRQRYNIQSVPFILQHT